jgi:hypothetical protein
MKPIPEVKSFLNDTEKLGAVNDGENWFVTEEWANIFRNHLSKLLPLAEAGEPQAQYQVAAIYLCSYIYSNEEQAIKNHKSDSVKMSYWFEQAAKNGIVQAIDNLIVSGVGSEAERLRSIYKKYKDVYPLNKAPSDEWVESLEKLWKIAYPNI